MLAKASNPWTDTQLIEHLTALEFDLDALAEQGIASENEALINGSAEAQEELYELTASRPRSKKCKNAHSHSARRKYGLCPAEKWADCPDNPERGKRDKEAKDKIKYNLRKRHRTTVKRAKGGGTVTLSNKLIVHLSSSDKNRTDRVDFWRDAKNCAKYGTVRIPKESYNDKRFLLEQENGNRIMRLVCVPQKKGKSNFPAEAFTFYLTDKEK